MGLSKEKRATMKFLSPEQASLPYLSNDDWQKIYSTLAFARFLFSIAEKSCGKTELDMKEARDDLEKLTRWIDQMSKGIRAAQEAKASQKKGEENNIDLPLSAEDLGNFNNAFTDMVKWAKNKGITIDIEVVTKPNPRGGELMRGLRKTDPDALIQQCQNISATLNAEVKNCTTNVQKYQSDMNTKTELLSAIAKKFTDLIQAIMRGV